MQLRHLSIPQFRNLREVAIDFATRLEPAPGTASAVAPKGIRSHALIGQNGVGKSNLIEALITIFRDVDLDRDAAKEAFGRFLDTNRYNSQQIRFVEMIIDKLTQSGTMDVGLLYEPPFTGVHHGGLDGAFGDGDADELVSALAEVNRRAVGI